MSGVLVVAIVVLAWLGVIALMLRGWRNRARRQQDLLGAFPEVPLDPGALLFGPHTGLYVGSTVAPSWQDRVAVGDYGDRASTEFSAFDGGILLSRHGANPIWIPRESLVAVRTERGLAGKVMTADGVLVIRWRLPSGTEIDSGLRADDKSVYPTWVELDPPETTDTPGPADDGPDDDPDRDDPTDTAKEQRS
ncbi:PH-like domain-containing protein [Williamsia sp. Leaf354]|uniref:PH-like domain-containing protein n=1 Tax=Williamsia sp. Leaf354 TaxID=1736349 RepID=UPI001F34DE52|nr:transporter [Williamsia sp. Leaf354]